MPAYVDPCGGGAESPRCSLNPDGVREPRRLEIEVCPEHADHVYIGSVGQWSSHLYARGPSMPLADARAELAAIRAESAELFPVARRRGQGGAQ